MSDPKAADLSLIGDVGGTHARFALIARGETTSFSTPLSLACRDYASIQAAIQDYLDKVNAGGWPSRAAIAVAGPVKGGAVAFTNLGWSFSEKDLCGAGQFKQARLLNDFAASALSIPGLERKDLKVLGPELLQPPAGTIAVMGPGTGFGVSALVRDAGRESVLSSEGGHISFAPTTPVEIEILKQLIMRHGRVSIERILSGPGVVELYQALAAVEGKASPLTTPEAVTDAAKAGDTLAKETLYLFCAVFGAVAGDFALAYGAVGGVYITGGVAPVIYDLLHDSDFRNRFEAKGRFKDYNRQIPTFVVTHAFPNLIGAARALIRLGEPQNI